MRARYLTGQTSTNWRCTRRSNRTLTVGSLEGAGALAGRVRVIAILEHILVVDAGVRCMRERLSSRAEVQRSEILQDCSKD